MVPNIQEPNRNVIITPTIKKYLIKSFNVGAILGGHPFRWNKSLERAEMGSRRQQLHWGFNMVLGFTYVFFVIVRCVQVSMDRDSTTGQRVHTRFMATFYLLAAVIYYAIIIMGEEFPCYTNQYLDSMEQFEREFVKPNARTPPSIKIIGHVMRPLYWLLNTFVAFMVVVSLVKPHSQEQLSSLISDYDGLPIEAKAGIALIVAYIQYIYSASANVVVVGGFCALLLQLFVLKELVPGEGRICRGTLLHHNQMIKVYRRIQVQAVLQQSVYNQITPSAKLLMMLWGIYCTYGCIKSQGLQSLAFAFVALFSFAYLTVLFTFLAELQVRSSRAKRYWRSQVIADRVFAKSFESLRDIAFSLRGCYIADRPMILTMLNTMIEETVTFLLLNR